MAEGAGEGTAIEKKKKKKKTASLILLNIMSRSFIFKTGTSIGEKEVVCG